MPIKSVMPSNNLTLCHPLLLLPSIFASIRAFSSESVLHIRWPKYRKLPFSFSASASVLLMYIQEETHGNKINHFNDVSWLDEDHPYSHYCPSPLLMGFSHGAGVKSLLAKAGDIRDMGLISGLGRSSGGDNGNTLQYSCLGNPMDRGAWQATDMGLQRVRHNWSNLACTHATVKNILLCYLNKIHTQDNTCDFRYCLSLLIGTSTNKVSQFSRSIISDSLRPHGLQHARPPCPSPTPGIYSNSCPLSQWCHPAISSSVVPFSSCLQSFPASGSFQMSQLFASGGESIGVSASASVLPVNIQDWFPLGWIGWISL